METSAGKLSATRPFPRSFLLRYVLGRLFAPVHFPEETRAELQKLARRGTLVYVMRSAGLLNFLYFNWAFARAGLPMARAVLGLHSLFYRPISMLLRRPIFGRRAVVSAAEAGDASMVFLRRPAVLRSQGAANDDPFADLVELQKRSDKPIYLVPQLLVFKRAPVRLQPGITDVVLGSAEVPGRIHAFVSFLFNRKRARVKIGKPIDLSEVVAHEGDAEVPHVARKVRGALGVGLARELRAVVGPPLKAADRLIAETLRDRLLRAELQRIARETGTPEEQLKERARQNLREISAHYSPAWIDGANAVARWVFNRIYGGIFVDEEGLRRAAIASKRAPLIFCPTHRSHVDYLLVSHVLLERGVTPPLVAAGANLSFWPIGPIFRRGGAFFIRRSIKGDHVYAAALSAYIRKIAHDGYTQEFYPEGGRTRTGRILEPKFGLISMEVDAWIAGARDDLYFVPVAIDYAKLIEAASYARELAGGEKQKEDLRGLLKTPAVLRSRWGHVHLQVDEPISLAAFAAYRGFDPRSHTTDEKKALVRALGHRIAWGMGRVQTITASALAAAALLGNQRSGCSARELTSRILLLRRIAKARGARFSELLEIAPSDPEDGPLREAIATFVEEGHVVVRSEGGERFYSVEATGRPALSFYKNNIVHHFEEAAILASALLSFPEGAALGELVGRAEFLSRLLKRELSFRADVPLAVTVSRTLQLLEGLGLVDASDPKAPRARSSGIELLRSLQTLLGDLVEAYAMTVGALDVLEAGPLERKELLKRCLEHGRKVYLSGHGLYAESLSKPTFDKALSWLEDAGHLEAVEGKKLALSGDFRLREKRSAFGREIARYLQRE